MVRMTPIHSWNIENWLVGPRRMPTIAPGAERPWQMAGKFQMGPYQLFIGNKLIQVA